MQTIDVRLQLIQFACKLQIPYALLRRAPNMLNKCFTRKLTIVACFVFNFLQHSPACRDSLLIFFFAAAAAATAVVFGFLAVVLMNSYGRRFESMVLFFAFCNCANGERMQTRREKNEMKWTKRSIQNNAKLVFSFSLFLSAASAATVIVCMVSCDPYVCHCRGLDPCAAFVCIHSANLTTVIRALHLRWHLFAISFHFHQFIVSIVVANREHAMHSLSLQIVSRIHEFTAAAQHQFSSTLSPEQTHLCINARNAFSHVAPPSPPLRRKLFNLRRDGSLAVHRAPCTRTEPNKIK